MAELSNELISLINSVPLCYLATANGDGVPDVAPLATVAALDGDTLIMAATLKGKSVSNLRENPRAALVVHSDPPSSAQASLSTISQVKGAQIKGRATILTSGDIHEQARRTVADALGPEARDMFDATIVFKVDRIYSLVPGSADGAPGD
jgi:predicted pyridoxine 5'-phosphate oxidase superfamily flavin-nucleotide-binding protein